MESSKEFTTELIVLYRKHRVLWDPTSTDYKNRNKRHEAWFEIAEELKRTPSEIEKKMRGLVGQFQRELRKGRSVDGAHAPYKTQWRFFKMLSFLKDKNEQRHSTEEGRSSEQDSEDTSDNKTIKEEERLQLYPQVKSDPEQYHAETIKCIPVPTRKGTKKRALDAESEVPYTVRKHMSSNSQKRDNFDVYGEYVAGILRNLKSKSILAHAKFEINNALYQAEIQDIAANTSPQPSPSTSFSPHFLAVETDTESCNRPWSTTTLSASGEISDNEL